MEAAGLHPYVSFLVDKGDIIFSSRQFAASLLLQASPAIRGSTLALNGFSQGCIAMSSDDITEALELVDASGKMLGYKPDPEEEISQVCLTPEGFYLFKARAFVASPLKKLRASDAAEEAITETFKLMSPDVRSDRNKRRFAYQQLESNVVLSQVWLDRDYYP